MEAVTTLRQRANQFIHMSYVKKDFKECLQAIEKQLHECNGQSEYALYVKGLILRQRGKIEESLPIFQAALHLNRQNVNNLKQVGQTLYLLGKHREAMDVLDQASDIQGEDRAIWYCKGLCAKFLGEYDDAVEYFKTSNSILQSEKAFLAIAEILQMQGEGDEALECYVEAAEAFPENTNILAETGLMYQRLGDTTKAFEYLGNALTYDPRNAKAILGAGAIIQSNGDFDVALTKYRVGVTKTPNNADLWNNIGMAFFGKGKIVAAISCLKQAVYLSPFTAPINYNLGIVYLHNQQYASAFHYFSAAINLQKVPNPKPSKEEARAYTYLALTLSKLDDFDNCCAAYDKAIELNTHDPLVYLNYATTLYLEGGEVDKAQKMIHQYFHVMEGLTKEMREDLLDEHPEMSEAAEKLHSLLMEGESNPY